MAEDRVVKWADDAMYTSAKMRNVNQVGPEAYLLEMNRDPMGSIASACKMYKGQVVYDLKDITAQERMDYLTQVTKTRLQMPFETVKMHFLLEGVTRGFTHQLVRQRTAAYAQESMRFAVVEGEPMFDRVALPPSLRSLPDDHPRIMKWREGIEGIQASYEALIADGVPAEDARGLLPTNITTRVHYFTDFRGLLDHAGNRLCTQAQFEWRVVFTRIANAIRQTSLAPNWQAGQLADLLRPVCYQTGKCEFNADFDRACSIRDRVTANAERGRAPIEWDMDSCSHAEGQKYDSQGRVIIPAIHTREWLMDPAAAR